MSCDQIENGKMTRDLSALLGNKLREEAVALFHEGIEAFDPEKAVASALQSRKTELELAKRVILISFGMAACPMANAALPFVIAKLHSSCIVTNFGNAAAVGELKVTIAGNPLPDERSVSAAYAVENAVRSAEPGDLVLVLVSSGASAMICAPAPGILLPDKIALNRALLCSGAGLSEINAVRQQFSRLKGGRLAQLTGGARVLSLILSDRKDADPGTIASGPTVKPATTAADALAVLIRYRLNGIISHALRSYADRLLERTEAMNFSHVENVLVGSLDASLCKVIERAAVNHTILKVDGLEGCASDVAASLHRLATMQSAEPGPIAIVAGWSSPARNTVNEQNQELALRFAFLDEQAPIGHSWAFLSGCAGDRLSQAAGAIVDPESISRMRGGGREPRALLESGAVHRALQFSGDLLPVSGANYSEADLQILLINRTARA